MQRASKGTLLTSPRFGRTISDTINRCLKFLDLDINHRSCDLWTSACRSVHHIFTHVQHRAVVQTSEYRPLCKCRSAKPHNKYQKFKTFFSNTFRRSVRTIFGGFIRRMVHTRFTLRDVNTIYHVIPNLNAHLNITNRRSWIAATCIYCYH